MEDGKRRRGVQVFRDRCTEWKMAIGETGDMSRIAAAEKLRMGSSKLNIKPHETPKLYESDVGSAS